MQSFAYECSRCGRSYSPAAELYLCPEDGGNLDVILDYDRIRQRQKPGILASGADFSIWRYLPLLPVADPGHLGTPLRSVGWTPLFAPTKLRQSLHLPRLYVKDDGRNPTASFKDRASAVVVARAGELGVERVVTASTGNAGAALAGMAAAAGLPAVIFAPKSAPPAKVAQLLIYGAEVYLVEGTYDDAFDLSLQAAEAFGWYCRNTGYNPFTAEGKKTAALEICEQLTLAEGTANGADRWQAPTAVFVSVGDGNIISGLAKGFRDLYSLGWIERLPRLYGVQASGSAAIFNAFQAEAEEIQPVEAETLADSISVDMPRDGWRALKVVRDSGGAYLKVGDDEILAAMSHLALNSGVFAEPAGAAAHAGLRQAAAEGLVDSADVVVLVNTGNGIKDVASAMKAAGEAKVIQPTMAALERAIGG